MAKLTEAASKAWEERQGPCVLTTVDAKGLPNSIWITNVKKIADDKIVVADNKFHKTRENIKAGSKVSLLYITAEKKAYQIKGTGDYLTDGPIYDDMKKEWLDPKFPGHAAVAISIEEVYSGAEKLA
jgi:predicted pyridoxine 5'-phosphate oxidase superfamily flavin-nucleotide-binding protein